MWYLLKAYIAKLLCPHEWKKLDEAKKFEHSWNKMPYKITTWYTCKKCGKVIKIVKK